MEGAGCGAGRSRDDDLVTRPLRPGRDGDWPERYILYLRDIVSANIQIMPASLSHLSPPANRGHTARVTS